MLDFDDPVVINTVTARLVSLDGGIYARCLVKAINEKGEWGHYYSGPKPVRENQALCELINSTGKHKVRWTALENGGFLSPFGMKIAKRLEEIFDDKDPLECPAHL